jgi:hypothetical protein
MRDQRPSILGRGLDRFLEDPASVRNATRLIVIVTVGAVLVGSLVMWFFDRAEYPDFGTALWFTLQTVTTVGFGDVTPVSPFGRVIAGIVMVVAIGFLSIVTALITSTFVEAAQRRRSAADIAQEKAAQLRVDAALEQITQRLDSIERALATMEGTAPGARSTAGAEAPATPDSGMTGRP